ncbi:MAG: hypothetical protein WD749_04395 [Phycisphaerales bacterium]
MPAALIAMGGGLAGRSLFVDPDCDDARFWAIDQSLRCEGVAAVVADASRLDMGGSRRLQLAAEAGGTIGLLARPSCERGVISAAETRWMVRPSGESEQRTTNSEHPDLGRRRPDVRCPLFAVRLSLELLRCKGGSLSASGRRWVVEWREVGRDACALCASADVGHGPGEATPAPGLLRTA